MLTSAQHFVSVTMQGMAASSQRPLSTSRRQTRQTCVGHGPMHTAQGSSCLAWTSGRDAGIPTTQASAQPCTSCLIPPLKHSSKCQYVHWLLKDAALLKDSSNLPRCALAKISLFKDASVLTKSSQQCQVHWQTALSAKMPLSSQTPLGKAMMCTGKIFLLQDASPLAEFSWHCQDLDRPLPVNDLAYTVKRLDRAYGTQFHPQCIISSPHCASPDCGIPTIAATQVLLPLTSGMQAAVEQQMEVSRVVGLPASQV